MTLCRRRNFFKNFFHFFLLNHNKFSKAWIQKKNTFSLASDTIKWYLHFDWMFIKGKAPNIKNFYVLFLHNSLLTMSLCFLVCHWFIEFNALNFIVCISFWSPDECAVSFYSFFFGSHFLMTLIICFKQFRQSLAKTF